MKPLKKRLEEIRRNMFCCREGEEKDNDGDADPRSDMITRDGPRFVEGLRELGKLVHQIEK